MSNLIRAGLLPAANNTKSQKQKNSTKRLSPNRFRTLKSGINNRAKNIKVPVVDFEFVINYEDEDLEISYKPRGSYDYEILIKNIGQYTNCAIFSYNIKNKTIELESILYEVADDDKCRLNKTGTYYIDLVFQLIKVLQTYQHIDFKPCIIGLSDNATKKTISFSTSPSHNKISIYKLLMDGRTFYEAYGFIPYDYISCSDDIDYVKFEKLISIRHDFLNLPIFELEKYCEKLKLPIDISDRVYEYIKRIIKQILLLIDINSPEQSSISSVFRNIIRNDKPSDKEKELCLDIYRFVKLYLGKILEGIQIIKDAQNFSYVITSHKSHYAKIAAIYAKFGIQRYEDYAAYLQISPE